MFVGNEAESKGVAKYKGLTTIATNGKPVWTGKVNIAGEKLFNEPKRWKESSIIFVNSMSDLFYEEVSKDLVFKIFDKMLAYNWHKYLVLTKRSERMKILVNEYCELKGFDKLPDFIWLNQLYLLV